MSSLLQFNGSVSRRGVGLQFYVQAPDLMAERWKSDVPVDNVPCSTCGKTHPRIHIVWRKPAGMIGCWVQFKYNGCLHAPDLSCPIGIRVLPRGAQALTDEQSNAIWHS